MGFYDSNEHEAVFRSTVLAATIISSFFSFLLMLLLYVMRSRSTGFTTIILAMTILQTMYDISFYYGVVPGPSTIVLVCNLFQISGGIGSSLFSNILAGIVYYVLVFRKNVDVMKLFPLFCIFLPFYLWNYLLKITISIENFMSCGYFVWQFLWCLPTSCKTYQIYYCYYLDWSVFWWLLLTFTLMSIKNRIG